MALYSLPTLPYAYDALEPFVDAMTMEIHHSKHHQTYVNNLNAALEKAPELAGLDLLALNQAVGTGKVPDSIATAVRNNGGGASVARFTVHIMCSSRPLEPHVFLASDGQAWRQQRPIGRAQKRHRRVVWQHGQAQGRLWRRWCVCRIGENHTIIHLSQRLGVLAAAGHGWASSPMVP